MNANIKDTIQPFKEIVDQLKASDRLRFIEHILLSIKKTHGKVVLDKDTVALIADLITPKLNEYKTDKFKVFAYKYIQFFYEQLPKQTEAQETNTNNRSEEKELVEDNVISNLKPEDCAPMEYDEEWLNTLGWEKQHGE